MPKTFIKPLTSKLALLYMQNSEVYEKMKKFILRISEKEVRTSSKITVHFANGSIKVYSFPSLLEAMLFGTSTLNQVPKVTQSDMIAALIVLADYLADGKLTEINVCKGLGQSLIPFGIHTGSKLKEVGLDYARFIENTILSTSHYPLDVKQELIAYYTAERHQDLELEISFFKRVFKAIEEYIIPDSIR